MDRAVKVPGPLSRATTKPDQVDDEVIDRLGEIPTVLGKGLPSPNIAVTPSMIK
jgi:hypothetical protein